MRESLIKIAISHGPNLGHKTQSYLETHQGKCYYVMITVLQHVTLHFGTGRVSVRESLIKIAISHGPNWGHKTQSYLETHQGKWS